MSDPKSIIAKHPFFQRFSPAELELIGRDARGVSFKAGDAIFKAGEPANTFYLLESGDVDLEAHRPADGTVVIQTLKAGQLLGWSWLVPPFSWHFTARAIKPVQAIAMNGAALLVRAEKDHEFGFKLLKAVSQIIIQRLHITRETLTNQLAATRQE